MLGYTCYYVCYVYFTDELPTLTVVVRSPFGRHAWTMQLRQLPRCKQVTDCFMTYVTLQ